MKEAGLQEKVLGRVAVDEKDNTAIGYWKQLKKINDAVPFKEIICCEGKLPFSQIIGIFQYLPQGVHIKFHVSGSRSIVGSNSKNRSGESVSVENGFNLANPYNKRIKRLIDIFISFFALITFPLQLLIVKKPFLFFANCFSVLFAKKTWIGYAVQEKKLPHLRPGVLACNGIVASSVQQLTTESLQMLDYWYARDWEASAEIKLLWKMYRRLGG